MDTATTLPLYFPGHHYLGSVMETVRPQLLEEEEKLKLLNPDAPI